MSKEIYIAWMYGDFDIPCVISVCDTFETADRLIIEYFNQSIEYCDPKPTLLHTEHFKYRKSTSHESETDYYITKTYMNKIS